MSWVLPREPFSVQRMAAEKAGVARGFCYFMEMGLGKTAVALNDYVKLTDMGEIDGMIVLCPPSLMRNWADEAKECGITTPVHVWPETPKDYSKPFICVLNYESLSSGRRKGLEFLEQTCRKYRVLLVNDESTQFKNPSAKRTVALIGVAARAAYVRNLTGAPIIQGPQDLWSQLRVAGFLRGVNYYQFRNKHCKLGGFMGKQIVGARDPELLNSIINGAGFRARKKDWTDLPPKLYQKRYISMTPEQADIYASMKNDFIAYCGGTEVEAMQVITQMLKLQQISSGFLIDDEGTVHTIVDVPPKMAEIDNVMMEIDGKLLVFAHFTHSVNRLYDYLKDYNPALMASKKTLRQRDLQLDAEKAKFNNDPTCRVMVVQTRTGKYGHTLLGTPDCRCSTSYFYENSYSLDDRVQGEDRNHRHGQDSESVSYIDAVNSDIDGHAVEALQQKRNVADEIVDGVKNGGVL